MDLPNLSSAAGVIALTIFLVAQLKPALATVRYARSVPTWVYTVAVALVMTFLANRVFGTLDGNLRALLYQSAMLALAAAGVRNIGMNLTTTPADRAPPAESGDDGDGTISGFVLLVLGSALLLGAAGGCETSPAFKLGASNLGPVLADRATAYVDADASAPEIDRLQHRSEAAALKGATQTRELVRFQPTADAWARVKPWLADYSEHDPALAADPLKLLLRRTSLSTMDSLVEEERRRRSIWFPLLAAPATQPTR